ncbi:hypothetical protein TNCV_271401 [Trichonephila clavipes]|nr:hypothetical protein TNCV_271401 [Trichonephila clavipes]
MREMLSPDLAPSDSDLFRPLKKRFGGQHFHIGSADRGICPRICTSTLVTLAELRKTQHSRRWHGAIYPQQEQPMVIRHT